MNFINTFFTLIIFNLIQRMTWNLKTNLPIMVAYFCHQFSDNYVDLPDLHVVLSDLNVDSPDIYVDLELIHLLENKSLKTRSGPINAIQITTKISDKSTLYLTSQHKDLTSRHHYLASRNYYLNSWHNILKVNIIVWKNDFRWSCRLVRSSGQLIRKFCRLVRYQIDK